MIESQSDIQSLELSGRTAFPGFQLTALESTPSTQDVVRAAARAGAEPGFCCLAGAQTAGRGRQGRVWAAPADSALLASVLVGVAQPVLGWTPLAAGLAIRSAVAQQSGYQGRLKWPNDLVAEGRKLAGVLCEVEPAAPGPPTAVAIGLGVNLRVRSFPEGAVGISLDQVAPRSPTAPALLGAFLGELRSRLRVLDDGPEPLRREWLRHAWGIGEEVTALSGGRSVRGVAEDIDIDGALIIRTASGPVRVLAGDVHIGPP